IGPPNLCLMYQSYSRTRAREPRIAVSHEAFGWFPRKAASGKIDEHLQEEVTAFMGFKKTKSIQHNGYRLSDILKSHDIFFSGKDGGARADLSGANLSGADLTSVNLTGA